VISDTHGLMRPEALEMLAGVRVILHAGDVGAPDILSALREIAPVMAVRGNIDTAEWSRALPERQTVNVERARIRMVHNLADLDSAEGCHAVISGHSHRAKQEVRDGVLYLNPGSAGPRRFRLPVTLAKLTVDGTRVRGEIVTLRAGMEVVR
jgi:putative phosphoesterase